VDTVRYYAALLAVITIPPAFLHWMLVHPFIGFWRRLGVGISYTVLLLVLVAVMVGMAAIREPLLAVEYGTSYPLIAVGAVFYLAAIWVSVAVRKHLSFKTFVGLPELAPEKHEGRLLHEGVYGLVRHPRYLAVMLGVVAWALFTNYQVMYLAIPVTAVFLYLITWLEEHELMNRFGVEYLQYQHEVPRLIPRLGGKRR
jgi:protein-S-isoprenylcysteine O-methyltransferase Ste14